MWRGYEGERKSSIMIVSIIITSIFIGSIIVVNENTANAEWYPEIELSTDVGTEAQMFPSIAAEGGKVHAVWTDEGDGDSDIYYRYFDGTSWQPELELSTDIGTENQTRPSIGADGGRVHVAWADEDDGNWDIYYRYFDGTSWQLELELSTDVLGEPQDCPSIAVEGDKVHVVWQHGGFTDIYYRYFDGMSWQPEQVISTDAGFDYQYLPSIAVDGDEVHVAWQEKKGGDDDIYYRYFDGTSWQPELEISTDAGIEDQGGPSIAANGGKVHVTWGDEGSGNKDIYYKQFNGFIWLPELELSSDVGTEKQYYSSISVNGSKVHVVWTDEGDGDSDIYYRYFDGTSWQPELEISTDSGTESQTQPSVEVDGEDVHVVWGDFEDGDRDIYYRRYGPPRPDLQIANNDIRFDPPSPVMNGTSVTINATVHNIGTVDASNVIIRFYDGIPPTNLIGEENISDVPASGGLGWAEVQWNATPPGIHNIHVVVDPDDTIMERNETNNVANRTILVLKPPDLSLSSTDITFNPSGPVNNGSVVTVNATIHNIGEVNASNVVVRFYDGIPLPSNQIDSDQTIAFIEGYNGFNYTEVQWTAAPIGIHSIYVVVDPEDTIAELNETNNIANNSIYVTAADYVPWNTPSSQQTVNVGSSVLISTQVRNSGDINATVQSTLAFYNQSAPFPFKTHTIPPLNMSEISNEYNATWNAPTSAGIYLVAIEADYGNVMEELNEANNIYVIEFNVTEAPILLSDYVPWNTTPFPQQQIVAIGSSVAISSQIKNIGDGNASAVSTIAFYNQSSLPFKTYTVSPLNVNEASIGFDAIWTAPTVAGTYYVVIEVDYYDELQELNESNNIYVIEFNVTDKPITSIHVGTPQYGISPIYVNSITQFWFTVTDPSGTGYSTYYYVDTVPEILYTGSFTIPDEGGHTIYYYSVDNLGGAEVLKEFDIIVDNTPPTTSIDIGEPKYISGEIWVTSTTEITLSAVDGGLIPVGVNHIKYRIRNQVWSDWNIYQNAFTLGSKNGSVYIEFYSVDLLNNEEPIRNRKYVIDNTPPMTLISTETREVQLGLIFTLTATDLGSGANYTQYSIDDGVWTNYSTAFSIETHGYHVIKYRSIDNLGNVEIEGIFTIDIPEPEPQEYNWKPLIALVFTIILLIIGTFVSIKRPLNFIKNSKRQQVYTWMIAVLPVILAEIATGVISGLTGLLSVPPFFGPGLVVDLAILILGLFIYILIFKRFREE